MHDLPYRYDIVLYLEVDSIFIALYTHDILLYINRNDIYTEGIVLNQNMSKAVIRIFYVGCNGRGFEGLLI